MTCAVSVRVPFHDPLGVCYRTLVIGADHASSGAEHPGCDRLAGGEHVTGFCRACANAYLVLNMTLVDTEWSCHPTPDGGRWYRFHDKNSVHMDGCHRVFVLSFSPEREVTDA